jgi:hypothetical protein
MVTMSCVVTSADHSVAATVPVVTFAGLPTKFPDGITATVGAIQTLTTQCLRAVSSTVHTSNRVVAATAQ